MVGHLLGAHPAYYLIPIEVRFLVDPDGLCDLMAGTVEFPRFKRRISGLWWHRRFANGEERGLHKIVDEGLLDTALAEMRATIKRDRLEAGRAFVQTLLGGLTQADGATQWIEMTPPNVSRGRELLSLVPGMKLVHSVRDGRDVASSVAQRVWGPSDVFSALDWWFERLMEAGAACEGMSNDELYVLDMEDLVDRDRQESLERLLAFVGVEVTDEALRYFETRVVNSRANIGRWRRDVDPKDHERLNQRYDILLDRLEAAGAPRPRV